MIPSEYPKWHTIYAYFCKWDQRPSQGGPSVLERALEKCVGAVRSRLGKCEKTRFCILDAQRVKNTDTAKAKGYDADKKVSGIKKHLAVDSQGLIHAIGLTTANVTDRAGAIQAMTDDQENLS